MHIFQILKEPVSVFLLQYFEQWEARNNHLPKAWLCAQRGLTLRGTSADCKVRNCQMKVWRYQPGFSSVPLCAYIVILFFFYQTALRWFYPVKQGGARVVNWGAFCAPCISCCKVWSGGDAGLAEVGTLATGMLGGRWRTCGYSVVIACNSPT